MSLTLQAGRQLIEAAHAALQNGHTVQVYVHGFPQPVLVDAVAIKGAIAYLTAKNRTVYRVALEYLVATGTAESTRAPAGGTAPDFEALGHSING